MNTKQTPPLQEWKALYGAALEFKELAPWDWMHDCDIFGVKDPESGEIGYCCIMGAAGEHYALGLYSGSEGLMGLSQILTGEFTVSQDEARFLTIALQQAIDASTRFKKDAGLLVHPPGAHYFVRVPMKQGENIVWQDEWLEPLPLKKEEPPTISVDETILSRLKNAKLQRRGIWGVDFFLYTCTHMGKRRKTVLSLYESTG